MNSHQAMYEGRSSQEAFALALHLACVIVQFTILNDYPGALHNSQAFSLRDVFMVENVAWLHEQGGNKVKLVLWAHNGHIDNAPDKYGPSVGSMGSILAK